MARQAGARGIGPAQIAAMAFGLALLGCQSPTVSPSAATAAETGVLHLTTGPDYDTHDPLRLGYVGADGFVAAEADLFDAETTIYLDRSFAPGSIHVLANGRLCDGAIVIQANVEVDALLTASTDGCSVLHRRCASRRLDRPPAAAHRHRRVRRGRLRSGGPATRSREHDGADQEAGRRWCGGRGFRYPAGSLRAGPRG
jgi:hypothetical protein